MSVRLRIVVASRQDRAADEVLRLAVAMGHRPVGVRPGGRPDGEDPWLHGVDWIDTAPAAVDTWTDELAGVEALVFFGADGAPDALEAARAHGVERFVQIGAGEELCGEDVVIARPGPYDDTPLRESEFAGLEHSDAMRVERLGMALLRAALEDGHCGVLDRGALMQLGDAVMLQ